MVRNRASRCDTVDQLRRSTSSGDRPVALRAPNRVVRRQTRDRRTAAAPASRHPPPDLDRRDWARRTSSIMRSHGPRDPLPAGVRSAAWCSVPAPRDARERPFRPLAGGCRARVTYAEVAEQADATVSKTVDRKVVRVRSPASAPHFTTAARLTAWRTFASAAEVTHDHGWRRFPGGVRAIRPVPSARCRRHSRGSRRSS